MGSLPLLAVKFTPTDIGPVVVEPTRHSDDRGYFSEVFKSDAIVSAGLSDSFIQDNESLSREAGTVRGVHFQVGRSAQTKLVRVVTGALLDIAVDLRHSSPNFGRHVAVELSADNGLQLYIPKGFGHVFCTLEPDTVVQYKIDQAYDPVAERSVRWDDPDLEIDWPAIAGSVVSAKDAAAPLLRDAVDLFE